MSSIHRDKASTPQQVRDKHKYKGIIRTQQFLENQADTLDKEADRLRDVANALRKRVTILKKLEEEGRCETHQLLNEWGVK